MSGWVLWIIPGSPGGAERLLCIIKAPTLAGNMMSVPPSLLSYALKRLLKKQNITNTGGVFRYATVCGALGEPALPLLKPW